MSIRGKRKDNDEWAYGDIAHIEDRIFVSYYNNCELKQFINDEVTSNNITLVGIFPFVEVIPETVGQDTGYSDKNFNRIFEDDIFVGFLGYHYVVKYYPEHAAFMARCVETNRVDYLCNFKQSDIAVVGNIHDNPIISVEVV